jgi:hydroxypyruvate isomerase
VAPSGGGPCGTTSTSRSLLTELPLLQRPQAARDAGFTPWSAGGPLPSPFRPTGDVDAFVTAVRDAGVQLVSLNAYGGDMARGELG